MQWDHKSPHYLASLSIWGETNTLELVKAFDVVVFYSILVVETTWNINRDTVFCLVWKPCKFEIDRLSLLLYEMFGVNWRLIFHLRQMLWSYSVASTGSISYKWPGTHLTPNLRILMINITIIIQLVIPFIPLDCSS